MKKMGTVVLAAALALGLWGCSGSGEKEANTSVGSANQTEDGGTKAAGEMQEIRMWTFLNPEGTSGREVALKQIITNFEQDNPDVKVVVEPQTWDVMTGKFFAADKAGNAPDVMWVLQDELGAAIDQGTLEPFENLFLKDWTPEDIADVDDAFWSMGAKDGKHYQAALSRNYFGIIYRADLFEKKGIELPKTWDQLIEAGKQMTETDEETGIQRYGLGLALSSDKADAQISAGALLNLQGTLFKEDGTANWNNEAGQKAMSLELDMIQKHGITPETAVTATPDDLYKDFCSGKYAMIMGAGVRMAKLQEEATFDPEAVQMMLLPGFEEGKASPTPIAGWSVGVWSGSKNKEAAGKLVEYMINPESDKLWVTVGGQVPVRKSTVESEAEFFAQEKNAYLAVMADGFANAGWAQPTDFGITGWRVDLNTVAQDVLANGMSLEEALAKAEQTFNDRNGN